MAVFIGLEAADVEFVDASIDARGDRYLTGSTPKRNAMSAELDTIKPATRVAAKQDTITALRCAMTVAIGRAAS